VSINVSPNTLPGDTTNALFAGLPLQEEPEVQYCGTLSIVVPEGEADVGSIANGISIPAACFPQPPPAETVELRMVRWDDEGRQWTYADINPGTNPAYPLALWPRLPLRIADVVRQLNIHYRRPGDEPTHRLNGWLTGGVLAQRTLTSPVTVSETVFTFTAPVGPAFVIGHYALIGTEVVLVTAISGTQIGVVRGRLGTSPGVYGAGTPVRYDRYCNPYHDFVVAEAFSIGGLRTSLYHRSRFNFFPGATPVGSVANFDVIIEDEDGDTESRGFVIAMRHLANPTTRDGGEVIIHLTPLTPLWAW
jgi:hypothetical protein